MTTNFVLNIYGIVGVTQAGLNYNLIHIIKIRHGQYVGIKSNIFFPIDMPKLNNFNKRLHL